MTLFGNVRRAERNRRSTLTLGVGDSFVLSNTACVTVEKVSRGFLGLGRVRLAFELASDELPEAPEPPTADSMQRCEQ
jgi:hypothetical protein